jgi:hypothetical protein
MAVLVPPLQPYLILLWQDLNLTSVNLVALVQPRDEGGLLLEHPDVLGIAVQVEFEAANFETSFL